MKDAWINDPKPLTLVARMKMTVARGALMKSMSENESLWMMGFDYESNGVMIENMLVEESMRDLGQ